VTSTGVGICRVVPGGYWVSGVWNNSGANAARLRRQTIEVCAALIDNMIVKAGRSMRRLYTGFFRLRAEAPRDRNAAAADYVITSSVRAQSS